MSLCSLSFKLIKHYCKIIQFFILKCRIPIITTNPRRWTCKSMMSLVFANMVACKFVQWSLYLWVDWCFGIGYCSLGACVNWLCIPEASEINYTSLVDTKKKEFEVPIIGLLNFRSREFPIFCGFAGESC